MDAVYPLSQTQLKNPSQLDGAKPKYSHGSHHTSPQAATAIDMSAAEEHRWRSLVFGEAVAAQRSALVLASYPLLLLLVVLAAFVRYLWIALAMYCALLFVLSCASRTLAAGPSSAEVGLVSRGGLSAAAIAAVAPAFPYKAAASALGEAAQCAVCLEGMKDGEAARRLPTCSHAFHASCIDMWLDSHATCPVCRSLVVPHKPGKQPPEPLVLVHPSSSPLPPV